LLYIEHLFPHKIFKGKTLTILSKEEEMGKVKYLESMQH
jgi:hypothetical protein